MVVGLIHSTTVQWQFAAKISTWEETFSASLLYYCFSSRMFGSTHPSVAISISLQLEARYKFVERYPKAAILANPLLELFPYSVYLVSQVIAALPLVRSIPSCSHTSLGCSSLFQLYFFLSSASNHCLPPGNSRGFLGWPLPTHLPTHLQHTLLIFLFVDRNTEFFKDLHWRCFL